MALAPSASAVPGEPSVGIHNDLSSGQPAVSLRTADYKPSGRIDEYFGVFIDPAGRKSFIDHLFTDHFLECLPIRPLVMLCGNDDRFNPLRDPALIFDGNLTFTVRP